MKGGCRQTGAVILTALLLMTLVVTISAWAWRLQERALQLEAAQRARQQAVWVLLGALDWARLILREDARANVVDHLAEPWAVPLREIKLGSFLASQSDRSVDSSVMTAYLSGDVTDLQSCLNVLNLIEDGKVHAATAQAFERLFQALRLPQTELLGMVAQLRWALAPTGNAGAGSAAPRPLLPRTVEQLSWLGLSQSTIAALKPYVVMLPERTPVNLNTAAPVVLHAVIPRLDLARAQRMSESRSRAYFKSLADAALSAGLSEGSLQSSQHSVNTRYFALRARLRLEEGAVQVHAVVRREGLIVKILGVTQQIATLGYVQSSTDPRLSADASVGPAF